MSGAGEAAQLELGEAPGAQLRVTIRSRAFPGGLTPADGEWLAAEIAVRGGGVRSPLRFAAFLRSRDFARFERDLRALAAGETASAAFWPADPWLTIELSAAGDSTGSWRAAVGARDPAVQRHAASDCLLDRGAVARLQRQVAAIASAYPVRPSRAEPGQPS